MSEPRSGTCQWCGVVIVNGYVCSCSPTELALRTQLAAVQQERDSLNNTSDYWERRFREAEARISELEELIGERAKRSVEAQDRCVAAEARAKELLEQREDGLNRRAALISDLDAAEARADAEKQLKERALVYVRDTERTVAALRAKLEQAERENKDAWRLIEKLQDELRVQHDEGFLSRQTQRLATSRADVARLRGALESMISYLGHTDQDANHAWMVREMRAALSASPEPEK